MSPIDEQPVPPSPLDHDARRRIAIDIMVIAGAILLSFVIVGIIMIYGHHNKPTTTPVIMEAARYPDPIRASAIASPPVEPCKCGTWPKKRIISIQPTLMISPNEAYEWLSNGTIMNETFSAFAQQQHNMDRTTMIAKYMEEWPREFVFNLHLASLRSRVRIDRLYWWNDVHFLAEADEIDGVCQYVSSRTLDQDRKYTNMLVFVMNPRHTDNQISYMLQSWKVAGGRVFIYQTCG